MAAPDARLDNAAITAAQFEKYITPGLKASLVEQRSRILKQFQNMQQTSAVIPFAQTDHFYSSEDDWIYEKDTVRDPAVMERFHKVGEELTRRRSAKAASAMSPNLPAQSKDAHSKGEVMLAGGNRCYTVPFSSKSPQRTGLIRRVLKATVGNPIVWAVAAAVVGSQLLVSAPTKALAIYEQVQEAQQRRRRRVPRAKVEKDVAEITRILDKDPDSWPLIEEWLTGAAKEDESPQQYVNRVSAAAQ